MPYNGQLITYRYKHFPLPGGTTLLCISITPEAEAPLESDSILWANLLNNVLKKHGDKLTLGMLKVGNQSYLPEPFEGSMKVIWNSFKSFMHSGPAPDEANWPIDADTAVR